MKHYAYILLTALILASIGFLLYGRIEHSMSTPEGAKDYNCSDFDDKEQAQKFFIDNGGPDLDIYNLDGDGDGFACQKHYYPKYKKLAEFPWKF